MKLRRLGLLCLVGFSSVPSLAKALATVESRTGTPIVRSYEGVREDSRGGDLDASRISGAEEDRAARLTLKQLEHLKQEVSELRGLVETQQHEIERLKKSQQDFYVDLDKRLSQLQQSGAGAKAKTDAKLPKMLTSTSVTIKPSSNAKANSADPSVVRAAEKETYETAYNFVRTKQYPEAVKAFQNYLNKFSKGERAPNAYYWLGEVYMVQWEQDKTDPTLLDKATEAFSSVTSQFPTHQKVADALLKLGLVEIEKGNFESAQQYFTQVKSGYPGTAAARIAETRLQQLN